MGIRHTTMTTPDGEELAVLRKVDFEAMTTGQLEWRDRLEERIAEALCQGDLDQDVAASLLAVGFAKADIEDILDAALHRRAMLRLAAGDSELLSEAEIRDRIEAPTPLAFWRRKRGLSQAMLADEVGIAQGELDAIELGESAGDPALFLKLAKALRLRMEQLVAA